MSGSLTHLRFHIPDEYFIYLLGHSGAEPLKVILCCVTGPSEVKCKPDDGVPDPIGDLYTQIVVNLTLKTLAQKVSNFYKTETEESEAQTLYKA